MGAYRTLQSWIRAWSVPEDPRPIDPAGATAACVTLRFAGRVMGRATVVSDAGDAVWSAARGAIAAAAVKMPVERDALRREHLRELAPRVEIDLQVAGPMTPILEDTLTAASRTVAPGRQGVAARSGKRVEAIFPGVMLSTNMTPGDGLIAALGGLGLAPVGLAEIRKDTELVLYRFDVQHLAQPDAGAAPIFLTRGGRVVSTRDITPASLTTLGDRLAVNLMRRRWPGKEPYGMRGTYLPWNDTYQPQGAADPVQQALAAYALARWAGARRGRSSVTDAAAAFARHVLDDLDAAGAGKPGPRESVAIASMHTIATLAVARLGAESSEKQTAAPDAAPQTPDPATPAPAQTGGAVRAADTGADIPAPIRAVRAFAHASAARAYGLDVFRGAAGDEIRALFARTKPGMLSGLMPWLGFAELDLLDPNDPVPSAIVLREFRDQVERRQITLEDAAPSGDEDLVGGIVFSTGDAALPTWQSLRPLVFLARMLGDDRLTAPEERSEHLVRLLDGLRYARQLVADDAVCHMFPVRDRALWGVRSALWDQRQPLEATALTLLLVTESLDAVDRIAADAR